MNPFINSKKPITTQDIEYAAAAAWGISQETLYQKRRFREVVEPRQVVFHFRKNYMNHSPRRVMMETGFNHAVVYHSAQVVENMLETDPIFRRKHENFINILNEKVGNLN